jgi:hypothetical protein
VFFSTLSGNSLQIFRVQFQMKACRNTKRQITYVGQSLNSAGKLLGAALVSVVKAADLRDGDDSSAGQRADFPREES